MTFSETAQLFGMELARQNIPILIQALFAIVLVPLLLRLRHYLDAHLDAQMQQRIVAQVALLVKAAEQSGLKDALLTSGAAKKQYVMERMQTWLTEQGYTRIRVADLSDMVEAAVLHELNFIKLSPLPPLLPSDPISTSG